MVPKFKKNRQEIDGHHTHQNRLIWVINGLAATGLATAISIFLYFSGALLWFAN
jgi:hypothetical protein